MQNAKYKIYLDRNAKNKLTNLKFSTKTIKKSGKTEGYYANFVFSTKIQSRINN